MQSRPCAAKYLKTAVLQQIPATQVSRETSKTQHKEFRAKSKRAGGRKKSTRIRVKIIAPSQHVDSDATKKVKHLLLTAVQKCLSEVEQKCSTLQPYSFQGT